MTLISYNKFWESEIDNIVSERDKLQDLKISQLKLEVIDTYKKTNHEAVNNEDVINKGYLDEKLLKISGHLSILGKDYNEVKLQNNKQSVEVVLVQRVVQTTIQILYDNGLFDNNFNADKALEDFLFTSKTRVDLEKVNDGIQ